LRVPASDNTNGLTVLFDMGSGATYLAPGSMQWYIDTNYHGVAGTIKPGLTQGATFFVTGVQLEVGPVATPFEYRPIGTELALCQRYFQLFDAGAIGNWNAGTAVSIAAAFTYVYYKVTMRTIPLITDGTVTIIKNAGGTNPVYQWNNSTPSSVRFYVTQTNGTPTGGFGFDLVNNTADAEL
jgi:hypothetical protein